MQTLVSRILLGIHPLQENHHTTTVLRPFFWDHPGEAVPEENFWTLWCKERLTEADILTLRLGATPSGLASAYLHHPTTFFTGRMPFLPPNQQHQSTEGKSCEGERLRISGTGSVLQDIFLAFLSLNQQ